MRRLLLCLLCLWVPLHGGEAPPLVTPTGERNEAIVSPDGPRTTTAAVTDARGQDPTPATRPEAGGQELILRLPTSRDGISGALGLVLLIGIMAVAPGFLMMVTSFTRIIIVLGFVRRALGTQTLPPNQVMLGLALFLTLFTMAPTIEKIRANALAPYMEEKITNIQAMERAGAELRTFMGRHTRSSDLALFVRVAGAERPRTLEDVPFTVLVPAFITSELRTSFQMGFIVFLPFIVIDLVVAAVLMALGMMMLPPVMISLPFKILLFVLVDGWALLVQGLVSSYA